MRTGELALRHEWFVERTTKYVSPADKYGLALNVVEVPLFTNVKGPLDDREWPTS